MKSFKAFGEKYIVKTVVFFSLKLAALLTAICFILAGLFFQNDTESRLYSVKDSFAYWVQVGDSFQINRTIYNNENVYTDSSYQLVTKDGYLFKSTKSGDKKPSNGFYFDGFSLYYSIKSNLINHQQNLGTIIIDRKIPLHFFVYGFCLIFIIICLLSLTNLRSYRRLLSLFTKPLEVLNDELEYSKNSQELKSLSTTTKILEISNIRKSLVTLAFRIEDQEKKIKKREKDEALSNLAVQVAHDIRSPLTVIASVVDNEYDGQNENTKLLKFATDRLLKIADDLLVQNRKSKLNNTVYLPSMLENLISEKKQINENICFELNNSSKVPKIEIDEVGLSRSLSNIINNAIDSYDGENGKISIDIAQKLDVLSLEIKDRGRGIPEHLLSKILLGNFSYGKVNGNGLGIKQTIQSIKKAGGNFNLISKLGEGTTAIITLPIKAF